MRLEREAMENGTAKIVKEEFGEYEIAKSKEGFALRHRFYLELWKDLGTFLNMEDLKRYIENHQRAFRIAEDLKHGK